MSRYAVEVLPAARRQVKKLSSDAYRLVRPVIRSLAENPRPNGYKPLHGKLKPLQNRRRKLSCGLSNKR
jgi:mRNA-degrading endonuclease RelE of RelBE toxin-antitoxin system